MEKVFLRNPEWELVMPDITFDELEGSKIYFVEHIKVITISGLGIGNVIKLQNENKQLSYQDLLCLFAYQEEFCDFLFTDDNALRKLCKAKNINAHGTLYILDQLYKNNVINGKEAQEALTKMTEGYARFPDNEINRLKKEWSEIDHK
jgi:predicted nucleic acid-binding protein